ncbi:MAG: DUF5915 domain-containing protein, partial [Microbacterium sp.]
AKSGDWSLDDGVVVAGGLALEPGEYDLVLETSGRPEGEALALLSGGGFVLLDTTTTPELEAEGLARDVIRAVQDTRKAAGFEVSDRIRLGLLFADPADGEAIESAFDIADISGETLAVEHSVAIAGRDALAWTSDPPGDVPDHLAEFEAGAFANRGAFTVSVTRTGVSA